MTKQWLMRRAVLRPVSRLTTAPISSPPAEPPEIEPHALPATADVAIVGGGYCGLAAARANPAGPG